MTTRDETATVATPVSAASVSKSEHPKVESAAVELAEAAPASAPEAGPESDNVAELKAPVEAHAVQGSSEGQAVVSTAEEIESKTGVESYVERLASAVEEAQVAVSEKTGVQRHLETHGLIGTMATALPSAVPAQRSTGVDKSGAPAWSVVAQKLFNQVQSVTRQVFSALQGQQDHSKPLESSSPQAQTATPTPEDFVSQTGVQRYLDRLAGVAAAAALQKTGVQRYLEAHGLTGADTAAAATETDDEVKR